MKRLSAGASGKDSLKRCEGQDRAAAQELRIAMKFTLLHLASLIAIFQAIMMALFFFRNKHQSTSGRYLLSAMLLLFALLTGCTVWLSLLAVGRSAQEDKALFIVSHLGFLIGPLLLLYVRSLLDSSYSPAVRDLFHGVPFLAAVAVSAVVLPDNFNIWTYRWRIGFSAAILVQTMAYGAASFRELRAYGLTVRSFFAYIDQDRFSWIRFITTGYVVLWLIQLQLFIGWDVLKNPGWCPYTMSLCFVSAFLFFNGIVYLALSRPELFRQARKYEASPLKRADKEHYRQELLTLMSREKVFLEPDLTLAALAERLGIAPCHLSQIINEMVGMTFRDLVNRYRVEESKRLLAQDGQVLSILGIALDSGFNSKSAFNSAFKKHTGLTPKEYRRRAAMAPAA